MKLHQAVYRKLSIFLILLMAAVFVIPSGAVSAAVSTKDAAVKFLQDDFNTRGVQNNDLGVGSYALFVLNKAGVDVSSWVYNGISLQDAVIDAVYDDISNQGAKSAKILAQDLAAAAALNKTDYKNQIVQILKDRQTDTGFDSGDYSIFSNIPAFDLLGRTNLISEINPNQAKTYILGAQDATVSDAAYGSWGYTYGGTFYPDLMVTAAAVRALHYLDPGQNDAEIQTAVSHGLNWLKNQQQADGSFLAGWDDPLIDTCEVILTLKLTGTDPTTWISSGGKNAADYLASAAMNPDGSFGTSKNDMDAAWFLAANNLLDTQFYLEPSSVTINTGEKKQFKAIWKNANGTTDVSQYADWSAGDGGIVSIDSNGLVSALKAGQTAVKAVYNGVAASAALTVSSSSNTGGGTVPTTTKKVDLAVVGASGELLFGPSSVSVAQSNKWGLTVLGALESAGISYHSSNGSYGVLVDSIEGQAGSGLSGWMYVVNGQIPGVSSEKYNINSGDNIIWYFSISMDQQPPKWNDLVNRKQTSSVSAGVQTPVQSVTPVSDTLDVSQGYFGDVVGHWGQKEIEFMAAKGYVIGVGDKKFAPDNKITRAEFVTILTRVAGLKANPDGAARFSDVPANAWYRGAVGAAVSAGLATGEGKDKFAPNQLITREQMVVMIAKLMAKNGLNTSISDADAVKALAKFTDKADISSWARMPLAFMVSEQLMSGRASNQFTPLGNTTRAEAAAALYRVLQKLPQAGK